MVGAFGVEIVILQTSSHIDTQTYRQTDTQTDVCTDGWTDTQTDS